MFYIPLMLMYVKRIRQIVWIGIISGVFFVGSALSFLEERLTCVIDGTSVIVSMDKEFSLCDNYLSDVTEAIETVEETKETIGIYIDADWNVSYRQPLYDQLVSKETQLINFRHQIERAMVLYESKVFDNIKPTVLHLLQKDVATCRSVWPLLSDVHAREGDCWQGQEILYAGMVASESLDEFVPLLIKYLVERKA